MTLERGLFVFSSAAGVVLGSIAFAWGPHAAISTFVGAAVAIVNLWILRRIVRDLVASAAENRAGSSFMLGPKLIALVSVIWLLFAQKIVSPGTFILGYSALPIGVAIAAVFCEKPR